MQRCEGQRETSNLAAATLSRSLAQAEAPVAVEIRSGQPGDMKQSSSGPGPSLACLASPATKGVGAVVIGGDFQGLGIVRSLGRHGVPICIIDDERSIAGFSRYATYNERMANLRDEHQTVDTVLAVGHRLHLEGWVLFPTRDETVAAFSRYRSELAEYFRVPTPTFDVVQWAWDKRNTYCLAKELGIPAPRTWYPNDLRELGQIEADPPLVIKPAIKEHFINATKAWKVSSRAELVERFQQAAALLEPSEIMIQELIPGDGRQQFAYCAFFKNGQAVGSMFTRRWRQHPPPYLSGKDCK